MISCLYFMKTFYNYKSKYRFYKGVKYAIKKVDKDYYYTVNNSKLSKSYENKVFKVVECI